MVLQPRVPRVLLPAPRARRRLRPLHAQQQRRPADRGRLREEAAAARAGRLVRDQCGAAPPEAFSLPLGIANPIKVDPPSCSASRSRHPRRRSSSRRASTSEPTSGSGPTASSRRASSRRGSARSSSSSSSWPRPPSPLAARDHDCYRTWQALYLRAVPIVTRSALTEQRPELPLIVLDDWSKLPLDQVLTRALRTDLGRLGSGDDQPRPRAQRDQGDDPELRLTCRSCR